MLRFLILIPLAGCAASTTPEIPMPCAGKAAPSVSGAFDPNNPVASGMQLVFDEEFNGNALNTATWATRYARSGDGLHSNEPNGEAQWYLPENAIVAEGLLNLTAKKEDYISPLTGRVFHYTSALITSKPSFNFTYGYMEARMWMPKGSGFWPAFWTWVSSEDYHGGEIDNVEFYGDNPMNVYQSLHWAGGMGQMTRGVDWSAGWHVYGANWEKDNVTFYIDGIARKTFPASPGMAQYLILNLAIANGKGAPAPNDTTPFPSAAKVDWVHVWQHPGDNPHTQPQPGFTGGNGSCAVIP